MRNFGLVTTLYLFSAASAGGAVFYPVNNGFEVPNFGGGAFSYGYGNSAGGSGPISGTPGVGWTFVGSGSGIAANGSNFGVSGATNGNTNPDGTAGATSTLGQAGFLQGGDGTLTGSAPIGLTQALTLPAGMASVTFSEEQRVGAGVTINVFLDGVLKGSSTPLGGGSFNTVTIPLGDIAAGSHTVGFAGHNVVGGDRTSHIDNVSIEIVPGSAGTLGDFNNDAVVDAADIDLLCNRINAGVGSASPWDVNDDGSVNHADLTFEVEEILDTKFGDTDVDGDVDLNDLGNLATGFGQSGEKRWSKGNFDCDNDVDLNDLGTLATNFQGGRTAAMAQFEALVPEPTSFGILFAAALVTRRRR